MQRGEKMMGSKFWKSTDLCGVGPRRVAWTLSDVVNQPSTGCIGFVRKMLLAEQRDIDGKLQLAVADRDTKAAVDLIRRGAKTSFLVDERPLLHHLVMEKLDTILTCCLEHGAELNEVDLEVTPLLHFAVGLSSINAIEVLLGYIDVNKPDFEGKPPIFYAVASENFVVIGLLLRAGASVNMPNYFGDTALHVAAYRASSPWLVKELLQKGANVFLRNKIGDTALDVALRSASGRLVSCFTPIIQELLAWGSVVDKRSARAVNVLVYDRYCEFSTLKRVVENTTYVNGEDLPEVRRTPLHYAVRNNRIDLAQLLLENGAKIDPLDYDGSSPLEYGFEYGCSSRMVMFMIDMGASVSPHSSIFFKLKAIARTVKLHLIKDRQHTFKFMNAFIAKTKHDTNYDCFVGHIKNMNPTDCLNFYLAFH